MSLRSKLLFMLAGVAVIVVTIITRPEHRVWLYVFGGILISPLWCEVWGSGDWKSTVGCDSRHRLLGEDDLWRSLDPNHISNGGPNTVEWSDG